MKTRMGSWWMLAALVASFALVGCSGQISPEEATDAAAAEASTQDGPPADGGTPDVMNETGADGSPDVVDETETGEAAADAPPDVNACMPDTTELVCCCDGDVSGQVVCSANGSLGCTGTAMNLYFGADCTRQCGPCTLPCPDTGPWESGTD